MLKWQGSFLDDKVIVSLMDLESANEIMTWSYPQPYGIYSMTEDQETLLELMSGSYYVVLSDDSDPRVIGYFCFGVSARIPIKEAQEAYKIEGDILDIGLGLAPDLCDKGLGKAFMKLGMSFAQQMWSNKRFRLTVADFNKRAIKTYQALGYKTHATFIRARDLYVFNIMII